MSAETTIALAVAVPAQLAPVDALMRSAFAPYMQARLGREVAADACG